MGNFNTNNFSILIKLRDSKESINILLGQKAVMHLSEGLIKKIDGNMSDTLHAILSTDTDIVVVSEAGTAQAPANLVDTKDTENTLSFAMAHYLSLLTPAILGNINTDNLSLSFNDKLNYREYAYYLTHTDVMVSPILYQWLENKFKEAPAVSISFSELVTQLSHLSHSADKDILLKTILILAGLGFININFNMQKNIAAPSPSAQITEKVESANISSLPDKLSVALSIGDNFANGIYDMVLHCDNEYYNLNLTNIQDRAIAEVILKNILSSTNFISIQNTQTTQLDAQSALAIRLKLYAQIKKLPLELFENRFDGENYYYTFSIKDQNYLSNLPIYRTSGMDIIDITLLSLLRIKNYSLGDISIKISSHTLSEIRRAIFGLILLGLIIAKREKTGPNIQVAFAGQQPTAAGTESNKSLLQKLMDKIKVK